MIFDCIAGSAKSIKISINVGVVGLLLLSGK
jgi:hypothetical protein